MRFVKGDKLITEEEFITLLKGEGYINVRKLPDGWVGIATEMMDLWPLCTHLDMTGYSTRYDYAQADLSRAIEEVEKMNSADDVPTGWIRRIPEPYFFTIAGYRENRHIGPCMMEREIITQAEFLNFDGSHREQPLVLEEAHKKLNEDGRILELFNVMNQGLLFIDRAEALGLGAEAMAVVKSVLKKSSPFGGFS